MFLPSPYFPLFSPVVFRTVTGVWCAGRLVLGYFQFVSTLNSNFGQSLSKDDHSMVILSVLVVCDILPICLSLTGSVGILLDGADEEHGGKQTFGYQTAPQLDDDDLSDMEEQVSENDFRR